MGLLGLRAYENPKESSGKREFLAAGLRQSHAQRRERSRDPRRDLGVGDQIDKNSFQVSYLWFPRDYSEGKPEDSSPAESDESGQRG